jgi:hypothetical protein
MGSTVVRLTYPQNGKVQEWCTGTVVGDQYILTAYHCTPPLVNRSPDWGNLRVELWQNGVLNSASRWNSTVSPSALVPAGATVPTSKSVGKYDVMLLRPTLPLPSWAKTVPMALAWPAVGTTLTEYGYGNTSGGVKAQASGSLQKTPQGDVRRVDCPSMPVAKGIATNYQAGDICAKGTTSEAWPGDSGGPLLWWTNGYWQQVGDASSITVDTRSTTFHGQVFWSESDTTTRNWVRSYVTGPINANTIVRDAASGASWLYESDGYRHWIPNGTTYSCLVSKYGQPANWPLRRVETIPDMVGDWAVASCPTDPPPPSPTVTMSWGARAAASICGGDTSCTYLSVSWANFGTGNHTITPYFDGQGNWCGSACANSLVRSGASGTLTGYWAAGYCQQSHAVSATVDGVWSNTVYTTQHGC